MGIPLRYNLGNLPNSQKAPADSFEGEKAKAAGKNLKFPYMPDKNLKFSYICGKQLAFLIPSPY